MIDIKSLLQHSLIEIKNYTDLLKTINQKKIPKEPNEYNLYLHEKQTLENYLKLLNKIIESGEKFIETEQIIKDSFPHSKEAA